MTIINYTAFALTMDAMVTVIRNMANKKKESNIAYISVWRKEHWPAQIPVSAAHFLRPF